jgi:hypothetical protein
MLTDLVRKIATYDLLLRLASEKQALMEAAVKQQLTDFLEQTESEQEHDAKAVPERLRKRLIGELVLLFDRDFPFIMHTIDEIDQRLSKIVFEVLMLSDLIFSLPEQVRDTVLSVITGQREECRKRLERIHSAGSEEFWTWLELALDVAERKMEKLKKLIEK